MSRSQQHRSAVKLSQSLAAECEDINKRAKELENQLTSKLPENDAARRRSQLCEVLSDILLKDPSFAVREDCPLRLFRTCFYTPISAMRARVSRLKRKQDPELRTWEMRLNSFLGEAVDLYDYLIRHYQGKLSPEDLAQPSSQGPLMKTEVSDSEMTSEGDVVAGLHRFYIHLGDLHRYLEAHAKAEECYGKASKLAPGNGNPYNQLAVVAQLKETGGAPLSCVALYWYARSLLTTHESFDTSRGNLGRLFEGNRDWLKQQPMVGSVAQMVAAHQQSQQQQSTSKKAAMERARSQKSAATRYALGQFVDIHFYFFREIAKEDVNAVIQAVGGFIESFEALLKISAFGDALLSKMVVINAFSICSKKKTRISIEAIPQDQDPKIAVLLAQAFTYFLGASLAQRVEEGLRKVLETPTVGSRPPSVRLLLPLLLLCEFTGEFSGDSLDEAEASSYELAAFYRKSVDHFWSVLVGVLNMLSAPIFENLFSIKEENDHIGFPKEYENLKGFAPFHSFLDRNGEAYASREPFISPEEARALLIPGSSQESNNGSTNENETRLKVSLLLAFAGRMASNSDDPVASCLVRDSDGHYIWTKEQEEARDGADIDTDDEVKNPREEDPMAHTVKTEDGGGDVLVYGHSKNGPLLMPGALLLNRANERKVDLEVKATPEHVVNQKSGSASVPLPQFKPVGAEVLTNAVAGPLTNAIAEPMDVEAPAVPLRSPTGGAPSPSRLPGLMPPPGFGPPTGGVAPAAAISGNTAAAISVNTPAAVAGNMTAFPSIPAPPGLQIAPNGPPPCLGPHLGLFGNATQSTPTVGESLHLFGGPSALATANPFAHTPQLPSVGNNNVGNPLGVPHPNSFPPPFAEPEATNLDGTSLLDSGLLHSLWMDETGTNKTKNPFAT